MSPGVTARSRSGSPSGARPAISCSRAIAAAGGTSSASETVSGASCTRRRRSSGIRRGCSARARSRSSTTVGCSSPYDDGGRTLLRPPRSRRTEHSRTSTSRTTPCGAPRRSPRKARRVVFSRDRPRSRTSSCGSTSRDGSTETLRQSSRVPVDPSHFSVPRAIEFPTENGLTAHALFYPPVSPAHDAPGGRAASVDRDEPRRTDEQRDPDLQPRAPVLDEPWVRRRRRQLRRIDGIRTCVPRAPERTVGRRRPPGLRQRCAVPRGRGRSRWRAPADPRWERGRLYDDLRAHVHGRVRRRRVLLRDRGPRAVRRGRDAQVRARVRAHARRAVPGGGGGLSSPERDPLRRPDHRRRCSSSRAPTTWLSRPRRPS